MGALPGVDISALDSYRRARETDDVVCDQLAAGRSMAKRIIVLSDGMGNSAAKIWRTNVWRIFEALAALTEWSASARRIGERLPLLSSRRVNRNNFGSPPLRVRRMIISDNCGAPPPLSTRGMPGRPQKSLSMSAPAQNE